LRKRNNMFGTLNNEEIETLPDRPDNIDAIKGIVFRIRTGKKTGKYEKQEGAAIYSWE
jgi:hypothetical protein